MNCALPEDALDQSLTGLEITPSSSLLAQLADGLHAMAQPLTVLRGALGALQLWDRAAAAERQRYVEMSATQTERLCDIMCCLRSLVDAAQIEAVCAPVDLQELVASVVEDFAVVCHSSDLRIVVSSSDGCMQVFADRARTEQALRSALKTIAAVSVRGDEIQLQILSDGGFVGFVLQNGRKHRKSLGSGDRLELSLAEASVRSQQGGFEFSENPFRISIRLPMASLELTNVDVTSDCFETAV